MIDSLGMSRIIVYLALFLAGIAADRLLVVKPVEAQTNSDSRAPSSITFGTSTKISVGMPKEDAIRLLKELGYSVGASDSALIHVGSGASLRTIGNVMFADGRVTQVARPWGSDQEGPQVESLFQSFWDATTRSIADQESFSSVSVRAISRKAPSSRRGDNRPTLRGESNGNDGTIRYRPFR